MDYEMVEGEKTKGANNKAIIYPAATVSGYGHVKSLGIKGVHVVGLLADEWYDSKSKYLKEKYVVPDPSSDLRGFLNFLTKYGKGQAIKPVLFMAEDLYAFIISKYRSELEKYYFCPYIRTSKGINIMFNKHFMYQNALNAGLVLPMGFDSLDSNWRSKLDAFGNFPCIIKPLVSRFTFQKGKVLDSMKFPTLFGGKALLINNKEELLNRVAHVRNADIEFCVSEFIPGKNVSIVAIKCISGPDYEIRAAFISRKVRQQPADFGTCAVSQAEFKEQVYDYAEKFSVQARYTGPMEMELKYSSEDNKWYFIEVNPRLGFAVGMAERFGVNLPYIQYLLSLNGDIEKQPRQIDRRKYWIYIVGDLKSYRWRKRNPDWKVGFVKFLKPYLNFEEAIFSVRDPLPSLYRALGYINKNLHMKSSNLLKSLHRRALY